MTSDNHVATVSEQVGGFIDSLKDAIASSMKTAAKGIRIEAEVARVTQRMQAFHTILQSIDAQKESVRQLIDKADSEAQRQSLRFQLRLLDEQSVGVLVRSGLDANVARQSIDVVDDDQQLYRRNGRRFERIESPSPNGDGNGHS
jgi:hypothetical protein